MVAIESCNECLKDLCYIRVGVERLLIQLRVLIKSFSKAFICVFFRRNKSIRNSPWFEEGVNRSFSCGCLIVRKLGS